MHQDVLLQLTNITINGAPGAPAAPTVSTIDPTCAVATGTITVSAPLGAGLTYSIDGGLIRELPHLQMLLLAHTM